MLVFCMICHRYGDKGTYPVQFWGHIFKFTKKNLYESLGLIVASYPTEGLRCPIAHHIVERCPKMENIHLIAILFEDTHLAQRELTR